MLSRPTTSLRIIQSIAAPSARRTTPYPGFPVWLMAAALNGDDQSPQRKSNQASEAAAGRVEEKGRTGYVVSSTQAEGISGIVARRMPTVKEADCVGSAALLATTTWWKCRTGDPTQLMHRH